jgi:hypothetical protein
VRGGIFPAVRLSDRGAVPSGKDRTASERQPTSRCSRRVLLGRRRRGDQRAAVGSARRRKLGSGLATREQCRGCDEQRPEANHGGLFARVGSKRKHNARCGARAAEVGTNARVPRVKLLP